MVVTSEPASIQGDHQSRPYILDNHLVTTFLLLGSYLL